MKIGSGPTVRDISILTLASHYTEEFCSILPALHNLTGSDYTSKDGRGKKSALQGDPIKYLKGFGSGMCALCNSNLLLAKKF